MAVILFLVTIRCVKIIRDTNSLRAHKQQKKPRHNRQGFSLSGRRGSNPRPSAWKADALSTELLPQHYICGRRWIRTTEGINQQIYSLPHLATLVFALSACKDNQRFLTVQAKSCILIAASAASDPLLPNFPPQRSSASCSQSTVNTPKITGISQSALSDVMP